jgi:nucleotidyltransferase substrate binding protein (TIGR01987 family)
VERLKEKLAAAKRAVSRLQEALQVPNPGDMERDAIIQRFEFSFEAVWKAAQSYLRVVEGLDIASPKGVVRAFREVGLFTEADALQVLKMTDDRNLTVHTYNEPLAVAIYERIPGHYLLLEAWLTAMTEHIQTV